MFEQNIEQKKGKKLFGRKKESVDKDVLLLIKNTEKMLYDFFRPAVIKNLNPFQRNQVYKYFEKNDTEYSIKSYREQDDVIIKIYPVGKLRRLAEQKTQEVLMKGREEELPPMGAYERFIIHDYLKESNGVSTVSVGISGRDRRVKILPMYGRPLKKTRRKLVR